MLSAHFDGKQSRDPVDLPSTSHPFPSLTTLAFMSREVRRLLWIWIPMVALTQGVCFLFFEEDARCGISAAPSFC